MASPLRPFTLTAAILGMCACRGAPISETPAAPDAPATPDDATIAVRDEPSGSLDLSVLAGARWRADGEANSHLSYRFEGKHYTTSGYPTWDESGRIELLSVEGTRMRLRFSDRVFDGNSDHAMDRWLEVADDLASFTMDGLVFRKQPHAAVVAADEDEDEDEDIYADAPE